MAGVPKHARSGLENVPDARDRRRSYRRALAPQSRGHGAAPPHLLRPRFVSESDIRGLPMLERRKTSRLSTIIEIISFADCGVIKQRRAIAAFVASELGFSKSASKMAYCEVPKPNGRNARPWPRAVPLGRA